MAAATDRIVPTHARWRSRCAPRPFVRRGVRGFLGGCDQTHFRAGHVVVYVEVYGNRVLYSSDLKLPSAERNDAADGIVRRDADGHAISRDDLDAEAAHPAAQLRQYLVARIDLHTVEAAAVDGNHGALDIYQVVLAQIRCPFIPIRISGGASRRKTGGKTPKKVRRPGLR